jgi:hypothetical protein
MSQTVRPRRSTPQAVRSRHAVCPKRSARGTGLSATAKQQVGEMGNRVTECEETPVVFGRGGYSTSFPAVETSRMSEEISSGTAGIASRSIRPGPAQTRFTRIDSSRSGWSERL